MAWWDFAWINNFGKYPDPEGPFPKPDINILAPSGTRFTAPLPGRVTGIDHTSQFGEVVTIQLDKPVNDAATHYAFLHLASINPRLYIGEHVNAGELLGTGGGNISKSGAAPGFALTASDKYGFGSGWYDHVKGKWIDPKLDPTDLLNSIKLGTYNGTTTTISNPIPGLPDVSSLKVYGTQVGFVIFGAILVIVAIILMFKGK